jgi:tetratricopeptide (TPR) repeat protein
LGLADAAGADRSELEGPARASLKAAGDRARSLGAYDDATTLYRRALALRAADGERRALLLAIVSTVSTTLDPEATTLMKSTVEECEAAGDFSGAADAETALSLFALFAGDRELGLGHGARAVELAERSGSTESLARALAARARYVMLSGEDAASIPLSLRAIELAEAAGLEEVAVNALVTAGTARGRLGGEGAVAMLDSAFDRAQAINDPGTMFRALNNKADLIRASDGLAASDAVRHRIEEVLRRFGTLALSRWFDSVSTWDLYQGGEWDEALRYAEAFFRRSNEPHYLDGQVLLARAWIALSRGDEQSASADLERARTRLREATDPQSRGPALVYEASMQLLLGKTDAAAAFVTELERLGPTTVGSAADCTTHIGWLSVDLGRTFEFGTRRSVWVAANNAIVEGRLGEAIDILDATGVHTEAAYARLRRAQREVGPWLEEAEAFYRKVGANRFLGEIAELRERAIPRSA